MAYKPYKPYKPNRPYKPINPKEEKEKEMKHSSLLALIAAALLAAGCASYKKSTYLNAAAPPNAAMGRPAPEWRVMPGDEITITVSTTDPEVSAPFYRNIGQPKGHTNPGTGMGDARLLNYLVDSQGLIDFPVLGRLSVAGLTARQCEAMLRGKLSKHLSEVPNVTVRAANFKVSVLGEVNSPGTFTVTDERLSVMQALALAGDMTINSVRDDVQLLRTAPDGTKHIVSLDLTSDSIASSPYYYLQQNDVLYVKPTRARVRSNSLSTNTATWISMASLLVTIASLVVVSVR